MEVQEIVGDDNSQHNTHMDEQRASNNNRPDPRAVVTIADLNDIKKAFNDQIGALTQAIWGGRGRDPSQRCCETRRKDENSRTQTHDKDGERSRHDGTNHQSLLWSRRSERHRSRSVSSPVERKKPTNLDRRGEERSNKERSPRGRRVERSPRKDEKQDKERKQDKRNEPRREVAKQIRDLEDQVQEMRKNEADKEAWEIDIPDGTPFSDEIATEPLPVGFKMPVIESYNGSTDPIDHLQSFRSVMILHGVSDAIMCRAFPSTLRGSAQTWYALLPPRTIVSFREFSRLFVENFVTSKDHKNSSVNLMAIKQHSNETLRDFVKRFNKEALEVRGPDPSVNFIALLSGIRDEQLTFSLSKNPPKNMRELLKRCEKYIDAAENMIARNDK